MGHEWTLISLCSCLSHRELRSWHVQREEYAAPDHGREYQLREHVGTVRQECCGKQQTGIWAGAGTSVQKRGQCVLCLAARSAPCSDLEGWTVHRRAEMVGLVPDRSQTEWNSNPARVDGCRHPPHAVGSIVSSWLCSLNCQVQWGVKSGKYMVTSPSTIEAQETSTHHRENPLIALPLPPPQGSPGTTAQAGCSCFPRDAEDTLTLSTSQSICLSDGATTRSSAPWSHRARQAGDARGRWV